VICVLAVIGGADGPKAIGVWATSYADWLRRHLALPHGIPSHDTIGRLLAALKPAAFQRCFEQWIASLRGTATGGVIVAIDGKALRRSHDQRRKLGPLFLVSAWSVQRGVRRRSRRRLSTAAAITCWPSKEIRGRCTNLPHTRSGVGPGVEG
jgi:hypothetical protein